MLSSELWPSWNQRLWWCILTVCPSVFIHPASAQGAAAEVTNARVGETVNLTAPVTVNIVTFAWYRGTAVTESQQICSYVVPLPGQLNGPQYTGRETCGPDGSLQIRDLLTNYTGNYTVIVQPSGAPSVIATRLVRVYGMDFPPAASPSPCQCSCSCPSWLTYLGVACGVVLGAAVVVALVVLRYERRLSQNQSDKGEPTYQNSNNVLNPETHSESMRKGPSGQTVTQDMSADSAYMELRHRDEAVYEKINRPLCLGSGESARQNRM